MVIVSDSVRRLCEVGTPRRGVRDERTAGPAVPTIARRVNFFSSEQLVKDYEYEVQTNGSEFRL